ncbi:hypothetical protein [Thiolapillus sp.]
MSDPVIKPLLPVWPTAPIKPAGKDVRKKKPSDDSSKRSSGRNKAKKDRRKHIDLYV